MENTTQKLISKLVGPRSTLQKCTKLWKIHHAGIGKQWSAHSMNELSSPRNLNLTSSLNQKHSPIWPFISPHPHCSRLKSILSVIAVVPEEWKGVKRSLLKIVFLREKKGWPQFWGTIWLSWNGRGVNFSFYEMHPEGRLQRQTEILWNSMQFLWKVFCISFFLFFLLC